LMLFLKYEINLYCRRGLFMNIDYDYID
jgi:hypothetical protein